MSRQGIAEISAQRLRRCCIFTEILIGKIGTCIMMSSRSAWKGLLPASFQPKAGEPLSHARHGSFAALSIGSLGIVYGDIGTSPLYAMDQLFFGRASTAQTPTDVLGGVSLVIWTITIIVAVKYAILVLRAQNDGEGGVFALYGLLAEQSERGKALLLWSLMLGAGLLFGDGIITPAISVLSAVEGLQVATPALGNSVVPITIGLLAALFAIQVKGTTEESESRPVPFSPSGLSLLPPLAAVRLSSILRSWRPSIQFLVWNICGMRACSMRF